MKLGGRLGYRILDGLTKVVGAVDFTHEDDDPYATSRLRRYFGPAVVERLRGATVLDYGCGRGADVVVAAEAGAARAIGFDIDEGRLATARRLADERGVGAACTFVNVADNPHAAGALAATCDFIISIDAFEHFDAPDRVLAEMRALLRPGGSILLSFGPPWRHPFGAHMNHFNRLPWIHFAFDEATIFTVRKHYRDDGARRFEEVTGGLNRMTVGRFEGIVRATALEVLGLEIVPIRGLRTLVQFRPTREYFTSMVRAELRKPLLRCSTVDPQAVTYRAAEA